VKLFNKDRKFDLSRAVSGSVCVYYVIVIVELLRGFKDNRMLEETIVISISLHFYFLSGFTSHYVPFFFLSGIYNPLSLSRLILEVPRSQGRITVGRTPLDE
jgi:hypothetical protein